MPLDRYIASAPADVLPLHCIELSHTDWAGPHRRVSQPDNYVLTLEATAPVNPGAAVTFYGWLAAGNWLAAMPSLDDSGIVTRNVAIDDVENELLALVEAVRDSDIAILCVYRFYTSDDLAVPKIVNRFEVGDCSFEDGTMSLTVRTLDLGNMRWPRARHTDENTPGYRGRW